MRSVAIFVLFSCLMAICNATTIVAMYNRAKYAEYNINDTACFKVDKEFNATSNNVFSTRFPVSYYANDDCTYLVGMSYIGNEKWQHITRPILSISVLKSW